MRWPSVSLHRNGQKLDPFKAYIVGRMKAALPDRIPATVLFREIKERGYEGGETRLKLFVRGLTPLSAAAPAVRFETTARYDDREHSFRRIATTRSDRLRPG